MPDDPRFYRPAGAPIPCLKKKRGPLHRSRPVCFCVGMLLTVYGLEALITIVGEELWFFAAIQLFFGGVLVERGIMGRSRKEWEIEDVKQ
jgi:hypothetical protein